MTQRIVPFFFACLISSTSLAATEVCNGVDDDGDGWADEDCSSQCLPEGGQHCQCQRYISGRVDLITGDATNLPRVDVGVPFFGSQSILFKRVFDTARARRDGYDNNFGDFSPGWSHTFSDYLEIDPANDDVVWHRWDGYALSFDNQASKPSHVYGFPENSTLRLSWDGTNQWTLRLEDGTVHKYAQHDSGAKARLEKVLPAGNTKLYIDLTYEDEKNDPEFYCPDVPSEKLCKIRYSIAGIMASGIRIEYEDVTGYGSYRIKKIADTSCNSSSCTPDIFAEYDYSSVGGVQTLQKMWDGGSGTGVLKDQFTYYGISYGGKTVYMLETVKDGANLTTESFLYTGQKVYEYKRPGLRRNFNYQTGYTDILSDDGSSHWSAYFSGDVVTNTDPNAPESCGTGESFSFATGITGLSNRPMSQITDGLGIKTTIENDCYGRPVTIVRNDNDGVAGNYSSYSPENTRVYKNYYYSGSLQIEARAELSTADTGTSYAFPSSASEIFDGEWSGRKYKVTYYKYDSDIDATFNEADDFLIRQVFDIGWTYDINSALGFFRKRTDLIRSSYSGRLYNEYWYDDFVSPGTYTWKSVYNYNSNSTYVAAQDRGRLIYKNQYTDGSHYTQKQILQKTGGSYRYTTRGQPECQGKLENDSSISKTCYEYQGSRVVSVADALGNTTSIDYTGDRIAAINNPLGDDKHFTYVSGLLYQKELRSTSNGVVDWQRYDRDAYGRVILTTNYRNPAQGNKWGYEYDGYNRRVATLQYTNDWYNWSDRQDRYFDDNGRLLSSADYNHTDSSANHDANISYINSQNIYDALGRVSESQRKIGSSWKALYSYSYDRQGNLATKAEDPDSTAYGPTTQYLFDDAGRLCLQTLSDAANLGEERMVYDINGNKILTRRMRSQGGNIDIGSFYDMAGRVYYVSGIGTYHYDNKDGFETTLTCGSRTLVIEDSHDRGHLAWVEDDEGRTFFNYDAKGRVVAELRQEGFSTPSCSNLVMTEYSFDANGNLVEMVYPSGRGVRYNHSSTYPKDLSSIEVEFNGNWTTVLTPVDWYAFGKTRTWNWGNGIQHYDSQGRSGLTHRVKDFDATTEYLHIIYGYNYDGMGNNTFSDDVVAGGGDRTYSYDPDMYYMTSWQRPGETQTATYDLRGNRTHLARSSGSSQSLYYNSGNRNQNYYLSDAKKAVSTIFMMI